MMAVGKTFLPLFCGIYLCSSIAVAGVQEANSAFDRGDWAVAHAEFEALARDGDPVAMFTLGTMHANGRGAPIDMSKAHYYWKLAAEAGHPAAMFNIGLTYANGDGVSKNLRLAAKWYREAAKAGYAAASTYYINHYEDDDYPTKQDFLESLAKKGVAYAAWKRGMLGKTDKERWQWFKLSVMGAGPGKAYAEYAMGDILWSGGLGYVNRNEAILRYKAAAEDPIESYATYDKAKEIADRLRLGDGVPKDLSAALWWYEMAQSKGNSANDDVPGLIAALKSGRSGNDTSRDVSGASKSEVKGVSVGSQPSDLDILQLLMSIYAKDPGRWGQVEQPDVLVRSNIIFGEMNRIQVSVSDKRCWRLSGSASVRCDFVQHFETIGGFLSSLDFVKRDVTTKYSASFTKGRERWESPELEQHFRKLVTDMNRAGARWEIERDRWESCARRHEGKPSWEKENWCGAKP